MKANLASPTFTGNITTTGRLTSIGDLGADGTFRAVPQTDGFRTSIGFYRNNNMSLSASGDVWSLGNGMHSVGERNFAIGAHGQGACLSIAGSTGIINLLRPTIVSGNITTTGTLNVPAITLNGIDVSSFYQPKFWVAFEYLNAGPSVNSYGQSTITTGSVVNTNGNYLITMPAHPNGNNYGIMVVSRAAGIAYANYSGTKSSTQFRVFTYNSAGTQASNDFMVHTVP